MNTTKVIEELKKKYPGKKIVLNDPENPSEIICEIVPASENPDKSVAIAVIDRAIAHYHNKSTEAYKVLRGKLVVTKDGEEYSLVEGNKITIEPNKIHSAEGHGTWIKVTSTPAWTPSDHFLVK